MSDDTNVPPPTATSADAAVEDGPRSDGPSGDRGMTAGQFSRVLSSPFRWLFYASVASSLGDWIGLAAIVVLTKTLTAGDAGSGRATLFALSGVMIARILPTMLLGPVAGVFADRWDRRRLLIATDIGRALVFLAVPFSQDVFALFLATIVIEVMATLFIPVKDAIVPNLVPRGQLVQANQLSLLATYGTLPLGGFAFTAVVVASGTAVGDATGWSFIQQRPESVAIWLNSLTFLASAYFVSRIPGIGGRGPSLARDEDRPGAVQEFVDGFRFLAAHPLVRSLVFGVMATAMAAGTVIAIGVPFAEVLNAGDDAFGIMQGVVGTGLVGGILVVTWLERHFDRRSLFAPGVVVAGIGLVGTALMPRLDLAMVPAAIMGLGGGIAFLSGYTMLQTSVPDEMRGRAFGVFNTGVRFALFVSLVVAPLVVAFIGPESRVSGVTPYTIGGVRITLILSGLVAVAGGVWSRWSIGSALREVGSDVQPSRATGGLFIVFEGGDGAGKSTQMELLCDALRGAGVDPVVTREPGGTSIGERIRDVVLDPSTPELADRTEALLYAAARSQHVAEVIAPALAADKVVVSDRYVDSSVVYQGVARGLGSEAVRRLNRWSTDQIGPDLVVLLDVPPDEGLRRAGHAPDRLEGAGLDFHTTVNEAFRRLAVMTPERYLTVDATRPVDEVHDVIRAAVWERLRLAETPDLPEDGPDEVDEAQDAGDDGDGGDDGVGETGPVDTRDTERPGDPADDASSGGGGDAGSGPDREAPGSDRAGSDSAHGGSGPDDAGSGADRDAGADSNGSRPLSGRGGPSGGTSRGNRSGGDRGDDGEAAPGQPGSSGTRPRTTSTGQP